ncbi:MAG: EscU/YscU/HrcU family type III secretion system export apparatus switch protein [Vulcanimicrobiaceae bacterium]
MADGAGEKHFEPTHSRLERAKREGNVAKSQELAGVAAFGAALAASAAVVAPLAAVSRMALVAAAGGAVDRNALVAVLALMLVPAACAGCASVTVSIVQSGGLRFAAIVPKPERLSPAEGLKRMCSRETAIAATRAAAAFACAIAALVPVAAQIFVSALRGSGIDGVAAVAWSGALRCTAIACAIGGVFAVADYGLQLGNWRKKLRMSFDELKREHKEHEGDPLSRGRRKQLHRQMARGSLVRVKDAAFVVTNPTHIAIALEYRPPDVAVPRVLVRAADEGATRVRDLAGMHRVPIVENVPLARALYANARAGEVIPRETYIAVAEIVASLTRAGVLS